MSDFPAAHSMDAMWFAVDEKGHIGCFDTGEAGAIPLDEVAQAHENFDTETFMAWVVGHALLRNVEVPEDFTKPIELEEAEDVVAVGGDAAALVAFLEDGIVLQQQPVIVMGKTTNLAGLELICNRMAVEYSTFYQEYFETMPIFYYSGDGFDKDPDHYDPEASPENPLRVEDAPKQLQAGLSKFKVNTTFGEPIELRDHTRNMVGYGAPFSEEHGWEEPPKVPLWTKIRGLFGKK